MSKTKTKLLLLIALFVFVITLTYVVYLHYLYFAYMKTARLFLKTKNLDPALYFFKKASKILTDRADPYIYIMPILIRSGKFEEALHIADITQKRFPETFAHAAYYKGIIYFYKKNYKVALKNFKLSFASYKERKFKNPLLEYFLCFSMLLSKDSISHKHKFKLNSFTYPDIKLIPLCMKKVLNGKPTEALNFIENNLFLLEDTSIIKYYLLKFKALIFAQQKKYLSAISFLKKAHALIKKLKFTDSEFPLLSYTSSGDFPVHGVFVLPELYLAENKLIPVFNFPFGYINTLRQVKSATSILYNISLLYQKLNFYYESITYASILLKKLNQNFPYYQTVLYLCYPLYYKNIILSAINSLKKINKNLNIYLILAIIREESHFRKQLVSRAGAQGLMQIMPRTARYLLKRLNRPLKELKLLFKPEINIMLGVYYFNYLLNRFDKIRNKLKVALAAYNAGPTIVQKWINLNKGFLYKETRNYVKKVMKSYNMYLKIYKPNI